MSLFKIQQELKTPKSQFNSFGNYNYRSVEDILNAVKPLMVEAEATLKLSDELTSIEGRVFIKAIACIQVGALQTCAESFAEQAIAQKGMSTPQLTLSASSFARKQALQGLLAIDDSFEVAEEHSESLPPKVDPAIVGKFDLCKTKKEAEDLWVKVKKDDSYRSVYAKTYRKLMEIEA